MLNLTPKFKSGLIATSVATIASFSLIAGVSHAGDRYGYSGSQIDSVVDSARVVNVVPVRESYQVNNPVEHCWNERVPSRYKGKNKSYTPEVVGALVGAAVGNQLGKGSERDVATFAGALLGTTIGRDIKHKHNRHVHSANRYEVVQRCEVRDSYTTQERIVGYNVDYKYRGNTYQTFMDQDPGDRIKVRVSVEPLI
jgi:uncharacterized protein YcfJ